MANAKAGAKKAPKVAAKRPASEPTSLTVLSETTATVPPTRDVPERVTFRYNPKRCSMFWVDPANEHHREWHGSVRGPAFVSTEGVCGLPLTETTRVYESAAAALAAYRAEIQEKTVLWHQRAIGSDTDLFSLPAPKRRPRPVDKTPAPKNITGYASDGRMVDDIARLLPNARRLPRKLPCGTVDELAIHARALSKPNAKALVGLAEACVAGKLRELCWTFTLGFRIVTELTPEELRDLFGGKRQWITLAQHAIEIVHDHEDGRAHYTACKDGVRIWNHDGSFEDVITPSVDAFLWALVHRSAVRAGTYDPYVYTAGLDSLSIHGKRNLD